MTNEHLFKKKKKMVFHSFKTMRTGAAQYLTMQSYAGSTPGPSILVCSLQSFFFIQGKMIPHLQPKMILPLILPPQHLPHLWLKSLTAVQPFI